MADTDSFECSEFSMLEILYMGHEGLTFYVESMIEAAGCIDPFDIIAEIEERVGKPIAFFFGDTNVAND